MPVEIRELIIKTQITNSAPVTGGVSEPDLQRIKQEVLAECLRYLRQQKSQQSASPLER